MAIKLLVADDQEIIRVGLRSLLAKTDIKIVGEAASGTAAVRLARKHRPDVVLMDVRMPDVNGLAALRKIVAEQPETHVLMWSAFDNRAFASAAADLGASSFVLKSATREKLLQAIRMAASGVAARGRGGRRIDNLSDLTKLGDEIEAPLTPREADVIRQLTRGAMNEEIASALKISIETVKEYVQNIFRKIGVVDRTQAAVWAVRKKLV
jgi:DNA-binding NarL/FixJ family response regulator